MELTPSAALFGPLLAVALLRERYAFYAFIASIPLFTIIPLQAVGHPFRLPELTLMILMYHYTRQWLRDGRIVLPNRLAVVWFLVFIGICAASVVYASVVPPTDVLGHPYNTPFRPVKAVPLAVSFTNVTQLLLRIMFVLGVFVAAASLTDARLRFALRWSVFGAIIVGVIGVVYQLSISIGVYTPFAVLRAIGVDSFPRHPGSLSVIPRMFSLPGEPGYTADFMLLGFAVAAMSVILRGDSGILQRREAVVCTVTLGVLILLSTSSTGYGGLVVFSGVVMLSMLLTKDRYRVRVVGVVAVAGCVLLLCGLLVTPVREQILYQLSKFQFEAGSGDIRSQYIRISIDVWRFRPILGVGVGSHSVPTSTFTILAETGILGLISVAVAYGAVVLQSVRSIDRARSDRQANVLLTVVITTTTLIVTNAVAKSMVTFLFPWYILAIGAAVAASVVVKREIGRSGDDRDREVTT